uniref:Uncharacterized protein n=1 Tax=Glossina brevipalpis TaxID=37001 RepID=A0A1A9WJH0_9MUSC
MAQPELTVSIVIVVIIADAAAAAAAAALNAFTVIMHLRHAVTIFVEIQKKNKTIAEHSSCFYYIASFVVIVVVVVLLLYDCIDCNNKDLRYLPPTNATTINIQELYLAFVDCNLWCEYLTGKQASPYNRSGTIY